MSLIDIASAGELKEHVSSGAPVVVHFWADWCKACGPLNAEILPGLKEQYPDLRVLKVEAEKHPAISLAHKVTVVPTFLVFSGGASRGRVDGAKTAELARAVAEACEKKEAAGPEARTRLIIESDAVVLFMKGSPDAPQCGFSRQVVGLLAEQGVSYSSFDILSDPEVRAAHKQVAQWPTYPALHVNGKLVGGLDIIKEMVADDELLDVIPETHKKKK